MAPPAKPLPKKAEAPPAGDLSLTDRRKPFLLLHVCCGPCATHVVDLLEGSYRPIGFFYNPNLYPQEEYFRRLEAAARVFHSRGMPLWVLPSGKEGWLDAVKGLEGEPEGGRRCEVCIRLRLEATARTAKRASVSAFATTLTIGPQKNSAQINALGSDLSTSYGLFFLEADFKKKDGFLKSVQKSKEMGLYRQDYCGCRYSMRHLIRREARPG